jgi:DNA-binding NarL/FixJ family response regulator
MTEGSPIISNLNNSTSALRAVGHIAPDAPPEDLVLVFAPSVPPQLEHWLRKRSMRMAKTSSSTVDVSEVRQSGARYVIIDADALPAGASAADAIRSIRAHTPEVRVIVLTHRGDDGAISALQDAGAVGVVIKQPYVADLVFSLQAAQEGRAFVSGSTSERDRAAVQITAREREVLELMANGHSNQAIGERLSISVKTVEAHRARLFKKLGASNVADAVLLAIRTGLVMP